LKNSLLTVEKKYYDGLGKGKGHELSETALTAVFAKAVLTNDEEMAKGGWI